MEECFICKFMCVSYACLVPVVVWRRASDTSSSESEMVVNHPVCAGIDPGQEQPVLLSSEPLFQLLIFGFIESFLKNMKAAYNCIETNL